MDAVRAALVGAGIDATDFGRFANDRYPEIIKPTHFDFAAAVPVLLEWLPRVHATEVMEAIVRSLTIRAARPRAAHPMIDAFKRERDPAVRWAIGNALDAVADESVHDDLVRLAGNPRFGKARQMIVYRLGRGPKDPRVAELLAGLCADEDVALHAMSGLQRQLGHIRARQHVEPLLDHHSAAVRKAAKIQMGKIRAADRRTVRNR